MKRAAPLLAFVACSCAATPVPDRTDLAGALQSFGGAAVEPLDLTHIACLSVDGEPSEYRCRWRQREMRHWADWQGMLAFSGAGWQLIDSPSHRP